MTGRAGSASPVWTGRPLSPTSATIPRRAPCPRGCRPTRPAASSPSPRRRPGPPATTRPPRCRRRAPGRSPPRVAASPGPTAWPCRRCRAASSPRSRPPTRPRPSTGARRPPTTSRPGSARASTCGRGFIERRYKGVPRRHGRQQRPDQDRRPVLGDRQRDAVAQRHVRASWSGRHDRHLAARRTTTARGSSGSTGATGQRRQRRRVLAGHHRRRHPVLLRAQPAARLDAGQGRRPTRRGPCRSSATTPASRATRPPSPRRLHPGLALEPGLRRRPARQLDVVLLRARRPTTTAGTWPRPTRRLRPRRHAGPDRLRHPVGRRVRRAGARRRWSSASADRCAAGRNCADAQRHVHWPDVPWDQYCDRRTCTGKFSPDVLDHQAAVAASPPRSTVARTVPRRRPVGRSRHAFPDPGDAERDRRCGWTRITHDRAWLGGDHAACRRRVRPA